MEICLNISNVRKTILKSWLKTNKLEKFNQWCEQEGMDPIEVKQALGLSSASASVESKDPSENIEKTQLQEDPHNVVTEYLNNVDSTELLQEFETDLTKSCIIDFEVSKTGIKPIMKNRNKLNEYINEYKETRLDELVTFLQSAGYNVYENRNQSSAELSKKARHALQLFWNNKSTLEGMIGYTQALKAYVILHTFDSTLKSSIPFIDIKRTSNSDLFVKKYEWKGFGAESYTSWTSDEYASAEKNSSKFFKLFLSVIPLIDKGKMMETTLNFTSLITLFAEIENWQFTNWSVGSGSHIRPTTSDDFVKMLSEYENNKTTLSIMRPIVRSLKTLVFGKDSDGKYYVDEFIRNLVINAYLKYEPARYLEVTFDATRGAMSYDLTQNVAMGARISLLRSIRGQLATLAEDSPSGNPEKSRKAALLNELIDNKYITKKFELASIKGEPQRKQRISDIFLTLFNIEIDEQLILKDDIVKIENLIQECLNILKKESTPKKVIDETGIYNAGIQSFENFQALTVLGKIMAASSATKYAKSVIKNGEGNNVPTSQLPNYITQWRERINDSVTGSNFAARNRKLLEQVLMQSIATVGEKKSSISKMTDSEILHMWISSHFCQRFMKDHKGDDVVFIQPTCFADKSTSFLFPIPYNETFSYGLGKSFTIEDIINKVSVQDLDAIYSIIGRIYSEDLLAAKIVADYKRIFPEKLPYSRSGWTNDVSENYELIVKYLNKQSKNPNWKFDLINKFAEAGVDCIEDVHYTNKGANVGALYELKIFSSEQNTKMLFEKIYSLFKGDIENSVWQSLRKDPAVVSFYKKRLNDSKFANDPLYQVKIEKDLPLTVVKEVDDEEGKTVTLKSAPQHVVPDIGVDFVLQPFFFTYTIFGKSINDYYFGSALAHPNKSGVNTLDEANLIDNYIKISGNQWITQTKRESVGGATYHSYYPNLKGGTPKVIKGAIIEDQETQMNNITGGIDSGFKPMDGAGYSSPILSRAMRVSLLDVSVGENKKTSYGVITSVGTQNNEKWAEYEITNAKMRHLHSRTPLRKMFKKMHSVDITNCETQTFYPTNLFIEYNEKDEFGNVINSEYKQVHIIHVENGKGSIRFVDGTVISEQLNTLDDLFHFIGDCFAKHKEDGQLVYSENTLDILYEYAANNDLIGEIIGYVINKSACKVGVTNLNPASAWSDDSPLKVFGIKSAGGGPMMDTDHSLEDSEGTESTQMLLALVQNGTSLSETMQIFNDIAEIIDLELREFEQGITDKDKRTKVADKYTTRSLKRKREGFSTAKQKIDDYHDAITRGENPEFPIFINDVNTAATSAIRAHVSSNIIKRKYGGIGAVNTPGYNTVMYHVMNGQPMLFEELREHPLYKECLKNGIDPFSQVSVEKQVQDENGNEKTVIVYNPFIVQVTESSPIDFEDTIVIRHKPVTYLVNSVEDIDGNISLSYVGVDGISYEIDPNDPLYNSEFGTYTSADLYIDENGSYTTDEWSSPIVIDSIEKYFTYRHRTDINVYNWTIMAHNLKGIDALYHFSLPSGSVTYSINETLYNKAMYFINQVADLSGDIEEQLLEMCRKFRWNTHTYQCLIELLNKYLGISDKKKILSVMSKDLRTALNSPTEELWLGEIENPIAPIKVESIPAQIIMGRTYAKQFGLRSGDSIYKIRQEGFWEERYKDRFLVSTNHELLVEKKADIVVFDGSGKRIFIKYDALGDFKPEGLTKSTSFVENSEGVLYYNGEEFIESDSIRTYSYQTITGSTEDVAVINNLDDLQRIKDAGFDVVQFNFTEDNYRYLLPVRYDFDKSAEHYLWDSGKRTDVSITRDSINNDLTKLLIPQLNASEQSSIMHLISKKLKRMSQNFEKSLEFIGTRIPCQSMQSFMACKVIAFTDVEKNEIFIPAKLAWIQGSDYDIDKLYLTGRIFGDNGTLYHHLNKNSKLRAIGLKNKIVDGLWAVTNNPVNQVSGTVAVNIDSLKAVAKKSDLASRQDSFSQFNPGSVASMIYENATGKEVIGISAVANKGNSVVSLYYNRKLASLTEYYIREDWDSIRNILRTLCQWDSEGNIYGMYGNVNMDWLKSWDLSKVPTDIVLVLNNIYRKNLFGVDVDLALGELLNAAADNAKELILKKINATGEWTDVWAYALTQGYSIDYIYEVVNDPKLRGAMTTRNIFGGFVQTKKSDILEVFPGSEIANWIKGAEEFSLISGITKINQGIKTTEFDYLVYSHKFEEGVTKQLFEEANHTETFSMQKFVLDPQYRADMIGLYESKKHTYNILAMFAEHPLFMSMWKAYFISSIFLQQLSPRETLNMGVISSKRAWYFGQISSDTFKQVSDNLEEKILKRFLKDAEIRKGVTLNISSIQHARNILHKALSKYFSEHKSDNDFTKNVAYTTIVPRFGYEEAAALTPGIDMFEVDKNRNLQLMYAKMLDALQRENLNVMLVYKDSKDNNRRVTMTLSEALWLYSMLFYKPNASMSFTRFVEESRLPNSLATAYYNVVNKLANSPKDIEKIANWSQTGEVAIKQFITKHLEEVSEYIKKHHLSTRVVHSGILENIESEHIKVYDETNLREFKKLGFTKEELQGVKAAKAFIYNGVVYINKNSTYADLFHEMIHIKIANLALTGDITKLQNMYVKISQTEYGQAIIAEVKMNPIYSNLEDADLVEEIVAKYYEQYPEQLSREFIGEINEEMDSYVKDILEDTISAESLQTTAMMQKVRTFRNKKLEDGTIERNCD